MASISQLSFREMLNTTQSDDEESRCKQEEAAVTVIEARLNRLSRNPTKAIINPPGSQVYETLANYMEERLHYNYLLREEGRQHYTAEEWKAY